MADHRGRDKLHPAAVRAAEKWCLPENRQGTGEIISEAIDDHLNSAEYLSEHACTCEWGLDENTYDPCVWHDEHEKDAIQAHFKSEGWEDLRRTAELLLAHLYEFETPEYTGEDLDALDHTLRRVRTAEPDKSVKAPPFDNTRALKEGK